jgi:hypothetical protein
MNLLIIDHLAAVIIFEHSFYILDKWRYLHNKQKSASSIDVALEQYLASPHIHAVRESISAAVQAYEEAVTTATRTYEEAVTAATRAYEEAVTTATHVYGEAVTTATRAYEGAERNLPAWIGKLPMQRFQRKAKEAFEHSKEKEIKAFERSKEKERKAFEYSKEKKKEAFSRSKAQAKAKLSEAILDITLNHRLCMFYRHVMTAILLIRLSSARP